MRRIRGVSYDLHGVAIPPLERAKAALPGRVSESRSRGLCLDGRPIATADLIRRANEALAGAGLEQIAYPGVSPILGRVA
ncbi:hypothetical protein [Telmatospirillum sp. J64-1]|uniref:hypothetical protein n=1 Tax=Telmatospirillum sp. J64-1 TaxID=2502183 RepID=UPI00115D6992|nr:hypothetical protein [Telmatospirillum sp. J64-1]